MRVYEQEHELAVMFANYQDALSVYHNHRENQSGSDVNGDPPPAAHGGNCTGCRTFNSGIRVALDELAMTAARLRLAWAALPEAQP